MIVQRVLDTHAGIERRDLNRWHIAAQLSEHPLRDLLAVDQNLTAETLAKPGDGLHQGGALRARGRHDGEQVAGFGLHRDAAHVGIDVETVNLNVGINQRRRLTTRNGRILIGTRSWVATFTVSPRVVFVEHLAITAAAAAEEVRFAVRSIVVITRVGRVVVDVSSRYTGTTVGLLQRLHRDVVVCPRDGPRLIHHPAEGPEVRLAAELAEIGRHATACCLVVAAVVARGAGSGAVSVESAVHPTTTALLTGPWTGSVRALRAVGREDTRQPELEIRVHVGAQRGFGSIARMIQYRMHGCVAELKVSVWQWRFVGASEC